MTHIVLLGDSIFDNAAYVAGGPDVIRQLRARLPDGWQATLRARDGAITGSVASQMANLPAGTTHLVVSIGGNDALGHIGVLEDTANSIASALNRLADIADGFKRNYSAMLDGLLRARLPTAVCTIYEPRFPDARLQRLGVTALSLFNDCITREAFARGLPLLDLRLICDRDEDYANPIEPSVKGGDKIAAAIVRAVADSDFSKARTEVFVKG
jgi:GDSL-like Lipase/Acylhydrolase family